MYETYPRLKWQWGKTVGPEMCRRTYASVEKSKNLKNVTLIFAVCNWGPIFNMLEIKPQLLT